MSVILKKLVMVRVFDEHTMNAVDLPIFIYVVWNMKIGFVINIM